MAEQDEINAFREILRNKPTWGALAGSELEEMLTTYVGQRGAAYKLEAERMAQEVFVNLAFNRESIMARAEDEGYIPTMPQPFKTTITIENTGNNQVYIWDKQAFVSDELLQVVVDSDESIVIEPETNQTVNALQLERAEVTLTAEGLEFEEFILGGMGDDGVFTIHTFEIYFDDEPWTNCQTFRNTDGDSPVYHTFYKMSDELAIRTGNGSTGRKPAAGAVMKAVIWHTRGERAFLVKDIQLKPLGSIQDVNGETAQLTIKTDTALALGKPQESIESVRKHVLSHIQTGPVVARNKDYEFMLGKAFPELVYLNVWGEKEMIDQYGYNLDYVNKSFFCFLIEDEDNIAAKATKIAEHYTETIKPMNVVPQYIPIVKASFQVEIQGKIDRKYKIFEVEEAINELLLNKFGLYKNKSGRIKTSDIYQLIIATEYFSDSLEHLNRKQKPYFMVSLNGTFEAGFLDEYIYLDGVTFGDDDGGTTLGYVSTSD